MQIDLDWATQAISYCLECAHQNRLRLTDFPERCENGRWVCVEDGGWVGGHWVGLLWLAWAHSGEPRFEHAAREWAARLAPRQYDTSTHDLGFLFELSHVLGYRMTGDETLKTPALNAARFLCRRFNPRGNFIQAWGPLDAPSALRGRAIIDTMMNLDLLFWASRESGEQRFTQCAQAHARTCQARHVRPNFSTAHVADFDPDSGEFLQRDTHQGLSSNSCWSRGQSWAVYGFGDCYRATGDSAFLQVARSLAEYALKRLPPDGVPYWDYDSPHIPEDVRDSSAAAILAAGLLSLADLETRPEQSQTWRDQAVNILASLWSNYSSRGSAEPCILQHGTRSKPHGMLDHGLIYGDYYFLEALTRLQPPHRGVSWL